MIQYLDDKLIIKNLKEDDVINNIPIPVDGNDELMSNWPFMAGVKWFFKLCMVIVSWLPKYSQDLRLFHWMQY